MDEEKKVLGIAGCITAIIAPIIFMGTIIFLVIYKDAIKISMLGQKKTEGIRSTKIKYNLGPAKTIAALNNALSLSVANDSKDASCETCTDKDLADIFKKSFNVARENPSGSSFDTFDGFRYTFFKKGNLACGSENTIDPRTQNICLILIDVNGDSPPNSLVPSTDNDYSYNDQYYLVITPNQVVPAAKY